jgi:hypothetical protein
MGYWQISAASAKIVSGFSLETNGSRLGFRFPMGEPAPPARPPGRAGADQGEGVHLNFKYNARLQATV